MTAQVIPLSWPGNVRGRIYVPPPIPSDVEENCAHVSDPWRSSLVDDVPLIGGWTMVRETRRISTRLYAAGVAIASAIAFLAGIGVGAHL
jgi:hypothetical protein